MKRVLFFKEFFPEEIATLFEKLDALIDGGEDIELCLSSNGGNPDLAKILIKYLEEHNDKITLRITGESASAAAMLIISLYKNKICKIICDDLDTILILHRMTIEDIIERDLHSELFKARLNSLQKVAIKDAIYLKGILSKEDLEKFMNGEDVFCTVRDVIDYTNKE